MLHYALFNAHPASNPPFTISLGLNNEAVTLSDCQNIPEAVQKMMQYCEQNSISLSPEFVLLYPIYMDAMNTESEGIMHQIAWLIKDEADAKSWNFNRIGGLTGTTEKDFVK